MKEINKKDRGFHWSSKAYYANALDAKQPEITFGLYPGDGNDGTFGEMTMKWVDLGNSGTAAQLRVFEDSWEVLASFSDVIQGLKELDDTNPTEQDFVTLLLKHGFRDLTSYPNKK